MNITIGHGKQVHAAHYYENGKFMMSFCGAEKCSTGHRWRSGIRQTSQEVTCKKCQEIIKSKQAAEQPASTDKFARDLYKSLFGA